MGAPSTKGEVSAQGPLTVQEAIVATMHQASRAGQPVKALAQDTRISVGRLYEILEGKKHLWAEEIPVLVRATQSSLVMAALARACGGSYVPLPSGPQVLSTDMRLASDAMHEFAQTIQAFSEALGDGRITHEEAERIAREGHEAISCILALVQHATDRAVGSLERKAEAR